MANDNTIVREERSFPVHTRARIQIMRNNKVQLVFPRGATLSPARTEFTNEADLLAYLKKFFPIVGEGNAGRMSVRRKGKYQRVDSGGRPIFTFGDPVLDLITDASGRVRVGTTVHDFHALLSSRRLVVHGIHAAAAPGAVPLDLPDGLKDTLDFTDGSARMRFHAWRSNYLLFWKMGAEIETWGENFTWARIDSQYGEPIGAGGTVGGVLCGVVKADTDEDVADDYVDEYEWGTAGAPQPASVRSMCSAAWRGQLHQQLVAAGGGCHAWQVDPPAAPPAPSVPPAITWTPNVVIADQQSKASPALAAFNDRLHMVHLGDSSNDIWHSVFDGTRWSPNVKIPSQQSKASPALAAFDGKLHMVHLGSGSNDLWHTTFDGTHWSSNVKIPSQQSKASPALAAFGGKLHMVHLGNESNDLWHTTFDGTRWSSNVKIPNQHSKAAPALAVLGGLHMVHLGDSSNDIWHSVFDGHSWSPNIPIPLQRSKASPALAALHSRLFLLHLGDSSNDIWQSTTTGGTEWTLNARIPDQQSKASPAVAEFRGSLYMVHLGDGSNNIWYSKTSG